MIKVKIRDKLLEYKKDNIRVEKLLLEMGVNPEDVLVLRDGKLITEDIMLKNGDKIEIYEVISRG